MFKRLKRIIKLSLKDPKSLEKLTDDVIDTLPNAGDGNAVFISAGSQEDYDEFLKEEAGTKPWYDRLKKL